MTYDWREDSKLSYLEWCRCKRKEGILNGTIKPVYPEEFELQQHGIAAAPIAALMPGRG
ncbi:MAG: hypothetical protein GY952_06670 [Rhodobacteraceae bacterium]|nr:hypothetical protein [Paracoccaceae bacterium]